MATATLSTRGGRVELKLGLKETYRTMLLQLKIQNAFLGGKREDEQGLARSDFEALVREHRAQCEYLCDEPDIPEFVEVCASALCLKRWETWTCAPRLCTSGDHRCVCVRVCVCACFGSEPGAMREEVAQTRHPTCTGKPSRSGMLASWPS